MASTPRENFDYILKYAPLISGMLIFFGFIKQFIFFAAFKTDIIRYMTLSECLIESFKFLTLGIFATPIAFWVVLFFGSTTQTKRQTDFLEILIKIPSQRKWRLLLFKQLMWPYIGLGVILLLVLAIALIENNADIWNKFALATIFFLLFDLLLFTIMEFTRLGKIGENLPIPTSVVMFIWAMFTFSIFLMSITFTDALNVKNEKQPMPTKITFKDKSSLITSDSVIFVEHLQNYTVLYDRIIGSPKIISNDQIFEIETIKWADKKP